VCSSDLVATHRQRSSYRFSLTLAEPSHASSKPTLPSPLSQARSPSLPPAVFPLPKLHFPNPWFNTSVGSTSISGEADHQASLQLGVEISIRRSNSAQVESLFSQKQPLKRRRLTLSFEHRNLHDASFTSRQHISCRRHS